MICTTTADEKTLSGCSSEIILFAFGQAGQTGSLRKHVPVYAGERGQLFLFPPDEDAAKYHYSYQYRRKQGAISGEERSEYDI